MSYGATALGQVNQYVHSDACAALVRTAAKSFVYSFAVSTLLTGGNIALGAVAGSCALLATGVSAVVTPLFAKMLGRNSCDWLEDLARSIVVFGATGAIMVACTPYRLDVVAATVMTFVLRELAYQLNDRPLTVGTHLFFF